MKQIATTTLGWLLVLLGLAALVLPGPGLLALVAGLALLSTQYTWAERRLEPVRRAALKSAADGVASWPRILLSVLGGTALLAAGVLWILGPGAPSWWPFHESWWLPGDWAAGASLAVSGLATLALVVYSYRQFRLREGGPG